MPYHPWIKAWNECYGFDDYFESDERRRVAVASYYGLCSFLDANVGRILAALEETGLAATTRVIFLADHGDNLGARALWGKSTMYEESAGIPVIMRGPGIAAGSRVQTPISHVDFHPTITASAGDPALSDGLPGRSIFEIAREAYDPTRSAFSEYHAAGGVSAAYMLRRGPYKYIHYTGFAPELFDLEQDPEETRDLAGDPAHADVLADFDRALRTICDPERTDADAKRDQQALIAAHGGMQKILTRGGSSYTPIPGEAVNLLGNAPAP